MTRKRRQLGRHPNYSEAEKQAALASLRANRGSLEKTARQTGINESTLGAWNSGRNVSKTVFIEHARARSQPSLERLAPFLAEIDARRAAQRSQNQLATDLRRE